MVFQMGAMMDNSKAVVKVVAKVVHSAERMAAEREKKLVVL